MKKETRLLALILLLTILLRSAGLEKRGIWYDDAFSIILAGLPPERMIAGTAADTMPPLYYLLLHAWMKISESIWFLRLPGVLFSAGAVVLLYLLVKRLFDARVGLCAAFLAAISPFQIYYAQELRSYALLECAQIGYLLFFVRVWQGEGRRDWRNWAGLVLCGAAAMYSHNLAVFGLAAPTVFLLARREWRLAAKMLAAQMTIGLLALPWLLNVPGQIAHIQGGWSIPAPGLVEVLQSFVVFTSNLPLPGIWLGVGLLLSLWALALIIFELARSRAWTPEAGFLAAAALTTPILLLLASYLLQPVFVPRGFLTSALAYNGLAGLVIARSWPRGALLVGMFIAGALIALPSQLRFDEFPRSPFREAAAYLQADADMNARIIHDNKLSYFPVRVYAPELNQAFLADSPGGHNDTLAPATQQAMGFIPQEDIAEAAAEAERVQFVVFSRAIEEYAAMGKPQHPVLEWLEAHYRLSDRVVFNDLEIYQFER